jgi:uncharacterized protein
MFWLLLDLDELDTLDRRLRFFSRGRFNLFSFHDADFGNGSGGSLRGQIEQHLAEAQLTTPVAAIRVMTMPRLLGYAFNPLTLFLCYADDESLVAVLYEVNNTFGERHAYLIPAGAPAQGAIRQHADKVFHVSPFLDMDMTYDFTLEPPLERMSLTIHARRAGEAILVASFSGERAALSDGALLRAFLAFPAMTLKVMIGIHYEALKLWMKRIGLRRQPPAPSHFISLGRAGPELPEERP